MNKERKYRDEEWLRKQYVSKEKSTKQIAQEFGYGSTTICDWLKKHGIGVRSHGEAVSKAKTPDGLYTDKEWLKTEYIEKRKSVHQIADECGASRNTITTWLEKLGIGTRDPGWKTAERNQKPGPWDDKEWLQNEYVKKGKAITDIADEHGVSGTLIRSRLDEYGIPRRNMGHKGAKWCEGKKYTDADWLRTEYIEKEQHAYELAKKCDVSADTIYHWLKKRGIDTRGRGNSAGENHPLWKGGHSVVYGPGWNDSKKHAVRKRDNFTCQDPGCSVTQEENLKKHGQKLDVHHLRKAQDIDDPEQRNAMGNLITLCRACHRRWEKIADAGLVPQIDKINQSNQKVAEEVRR